MAETERDADSILLAGGFEAHAVARDVLSLWCEWVGAGGGGGGRRVGGARGERDGGRMMKAVEEEG